MYKKDMIEQLKGVYGNVPVICMDPNKKVYQISSLTVVQAKGVPIAVLADITLTEDEKNGMC